MNQLHESDQRLISMIREAEGLSNIDPAPKLNTLNFLVFSDQAMATLAADDALSHGWAIDEGPTQSPDTGHWHLNLKGIEKEISEESVLEFRTELESIAAQYGGTFEYWGAAQSKKAKANLPSQYFEPLSQEAEQFQESLREFARQAEVDNDPTAITELFNAVFIDWINLPEHQRDPRPQIISVIAVALGDWIASHTDLEWQMLYEGSTKQAAMASAPNLVLRSTSTDAIMFIFDSVAKRWGSRERLDDFAYGAVRQMRNHAPQACASIPAPPQVIRVEPFDSVDNDFRKDALKRYEAWADDYSAESLERAFAHAFAQTTSETNSEQVIKEQNEALEPLRFAFGECLRQRLAPRPSAWVTVHQSDGTKFDALATESVVITEIYSGITEFANKNGKGFATYVEDLITTIENNPDIPEI